MKHLVPFIIGVFALVVSGCASSSKNKDIDHMLDHDVGDLNPSLAEQIMSEPAPKVKQRVKPGHKSKSQLLSQTDNKSQSQVRVEGELNRKVRWWLHYYTVRDRERFERNLERGENYRLLVAQILNEQKLPPELYYLAMIESGYVNHATSSTRAVGIWQFMRPTALNYGLKVGEGVDERSHPIPATEAAARYLSDLYRKFDSWYLAIAAFNAGPGRIKQAIRQGNTRDFWELADGGYLPQETMDYIPKFLAAISIGTHLKQFGFKKMEATREWPEIATVELKTKMKVSAIASLAAISEQDLLRMNPRLKQQLAAKSSKRIRIYVPLKSAGYFTDHHGTVVAQRDKVRTYHAKL